MSNKLEFGSWPLDEVDDQDFLLRKTGGLMGLLRGMERRGLIESFIDLDGEVRWRAVSDKKLDDNIPDNFGLDS
jgi:hypothetical protein